MSADEGGGVESDERENGICVEGDSSEEPNNWLVWGELHTFGGSASALRMCTRFRLTDVGGKVTRSLRTSSRLAWSAKGAIQCSIDGANTLTHVMGVSLCGWIAEADCFWASVSTGIQTAVRCIRRGIRTNTSHHQGTCQNHHHQHHKSDWRSRAARAVRDVLLIVSSPARCSDYGRGSGRLCQSQGSGPEGGSRKRLFFPCGRWCRPLRRTRRRHRSLRFRCLLKRLLEQHGVAGRARLRRWAQGRRDETRLERSGSESAMGFREQEPPPLMMM